MRLTMTEAFGPRVRTNTKEIRAAVKEAEKRGYKVLFMNHVATPDLPLPPHLSHVAGLVLKDRLEVRVRVRGVSQAQVAAIIRHEIEHIDGAERASDCPEHDLYCGGTVTLNYYEKTQD